MSKVLAAVDLGPRSHLVLRIAARRAREAGAALGVCHVTSDAAAGRALAARLLETLGGGAEVETFVEGGDAREAIVRRAREWGAGLVVVGGREPSGLFASLLGGVAERVVRHAHCPVIVARNLRERGHVLAATDLSDPSVPAVEAGIAEGRLRGGGVTVVHVLPLATSIGDGSMGAPLASVTAPVALGDDVRAAYETRVADLMARRGLPPSEATIHIASGPAAASITSLARSLDAELVVVGTHGRTGLSRVLLGSVAEEVARTADSSVVVVRLGFESKSRSAPPGSAP